MAQNLDFYIVHYGKELINLPIQTLINIINHPNRQITEHNRLYELIIEYHKQTNDFNIFTLLPFVDSRYLNDENKKESIDLYNYHGNFVPSFSFSSISSLISKLKMYQRNYFSLIKFLYSKRKECQTSSILKIATNIVLSDCEDDDINDAINYEIKTINSDDELTFLLNDYDMSVEIISTNDVKGSIVIPKFVDFQSKKYVIKTLNIAVFKNTKLTSLSFLNDSDVKVFRNKCWHNHKFIRSSLNDNWFSSITYIKIPSKVEKLTEGWCCSLKNLINVEISKNNKNF